MDKFMEKYSFWLTGALGVAALIWLILTWNTTSMVSKLPIMYMVALAVHETEELKLPGGFVELCTSLTGLQIGNLGMAKFVLLLFTLYASLIPAIFSSNTWMIMGTMLIGVIEVLMHLIAARVNPKKFYSPGMITAILIQFPVSLYGFYYLFSNDLIRSIYWIYALLFLFIPLFGAQATVVISSGMNYKDFMGGAMKSLFTKDGREAAKKKLK